MKSFGMTLRFFLKIKTHVFVCPGEDISGIIKQIGRGFQTLIYVAFLSYRSCMRDKQVNKVTRYKHHAEKLYHSKMIDITSYFYLLPFYFPPACCINGTGKFTNQVDQ